MTVVPTGATPASAVSSVVPSVTVNPLAVTDVEPVDDGVGLLPSGRPESAGVSVRREVAVAVSRVSWEPSELHPEAARTSAMTSTHATTLRVAHNHFEKPVDMAPH